MLYLGCPVWANAEWKQSIFAKGSTQATYLAQYSQLFNTVEGNTSFYADPDADTLKRWYSDSAAGFRFMLKVPQRISHQADNDCVPLITQWLDNLAPLAEKLSLVHLQLPARTGPGHLAHITALTEQISQRYRCAVEVRHPAFFDKAQHEISLHKMLQQFNAERVVIDSRSLFAVSATDAALQQAQAKKPRLPVHAISFSQTPVLRFIGTNDMAHNRHYYQPWLNKIRQWLNEGKSPFCFFHTPDNQLAPQLCRQFAADLDYAHSCLSPWPGEQQFSLL